MKKRLTLSWLLRILFGALSISCVLFVADVAFAQAPAPTETPVEGAPEAPEAPESPAESSLPQIPRVPSMPQSPGPVQAAEPPGTSGAPSKPALPAAPKPPTLGTSEPKRDEHWWEKLKFRGYTQFRYNRIPTFNDNDNLVNAQGDRTIGKGNGFSIRRARVILYGDVHERVSIYIQPDFASVIDSQLNVAILRDLYADLFLDKKKEFRFRVGQSKVPYGFENMQSSQNRLALDRNDALNSAVKDERDIGVFFYWAPAEIRARFKYLVDSGLKGSGDYGVVGFGVYNGQTANRPALDDNMHTVARVAWPFKLGEQFLELGVGGYYGKYSTEIDDKGYRLPRSKIRDGRGFATFVLYPQPFGIQAEATYGVGPSMGKHGEPDEFLVEARKLYGGYLQLMYKADDVLRTTAMIPYARATYYDGGKKFEKNAPHYVVRELEVGLEWQFIKNLELVLAYDMADRTSSKTYKREKGHVGRVQVQVNY